MTKTEFLLTTYTISTIDKNKEKYQLVDSIPNSPNKYHRKSKGLISFCGCLCVFQGWFHAVTCNESPEKRTISTLMESTRSTPQVPGLLWPTAIWHVTVEDGRYWLLATLTAGRHRMWNYETQTTQSWLVTSPFCNMRTASRITKKWPEIRLNIA